MNIFYLTAFLIAGTNSYSPHKTLKVTNVYLCPDVENALRFDERQLDNIDDNGFKKFSGEFELPSDFDESWQYELIADKLDNGDWQERVYFRNGDFCADVKEYFPEAWEKIAVNLDPPFESECSIKAGLHKIKDLQIFKHEYRFPNMMTGLVRMTVTLFDAVGLPVFCGVLEAENF